MKSGVYCLEFKNGQQYVGKSVDIQRRWSEHAEAFRNGTAAKSMQYAYNNNGFPKARVLIKCHTDHIDIMESYYICKLQPQLNAVGGIALANGDLEFLEHNTPILQHSTVEHVRLLLRLQDEKDTVVEKLAELERHSTEEMLRLDLDNRLKDLDQLNTDLYQEVATLEERIDELEKESAAWEYEAKKPWWKRIFR